MRPVADFTCPTCGISHVSATYAIRSDDNAKICDPCAHASELRSAESDPIVYAYLSNDGREITGWTGNVLARVTRLNWSNGGFHGSRQYFVRATTPGGRKLYGRGPGKGMYCRLRPVKGGR